MAHSDKVSPEYPLAMRESVAQSYAAMASRLVNAELDVAITFCQVASTVRDVPRRNRSIELARKGYEKAAHIRRDLRPNLISGGAMAEIDHKLTQLDKLLHSFE